MKMLLPVAHALIAAAMRIRTADISLFSPMSHYAAVFRHYLPFRRHAATLWLRQRSHMLFFDSA